MKSDPLRPLQPSPKTMSDAELRRAYLATDGEPGDPLADALLAEIARRGLDI